MNKSIHFILIGLIVVLSLFATTMGLFWQTEGQPYEFQTLRGETVMIHGEGLYQNDTVSIAAQAIAQDIVTLLVGIPMLIIATIQFRKGSLQGKLLLAGILGYFLYTYTSYSNGLAYNSLFLVYVTLFALVLFTFISTLKTIDIPSLPDHLSAHLPNRGIAIFLFVFGGFLLLAWLERIGTGWLTNQPPFGLESYTTLAVQVLDLGIIVPTSFLSGVLIWKQRPWGYMLSSIMLICGLTMFLAIIAMIINEYLAGVHLTMAEVLIFPTITLINIGLAVALLKNASRPSPAAA